MSDTPPIAPPEDADVALARRLQAAVQEVNRLCTEARSQGLTIEHQMLDHYDMVLPAPLPRLSVKLSRTISL